MIKGIHHTALIVSCEEAVLFYERFGFKRIKTVDRGTDKVIITSDGNICLEFFVDGKHLENKTGEELLGFRHIAFKTDSVEEFLKNYGFSNVEVKRDWNNEKIAFIKDFDGNTLEIHE